MADTTQALEDAQCAKINFNNVLRMMQPAMRAQLSSFPLWIMANEQLDAAIRQLGGKPEETE